MSKKLLYISLLLTATLVRLAHAQTTAFTYQGELKDGANVANGLYDMRFTLFNSDIGGGSVGADNCFDNVNVVDGRFTVTLDFGQVFITTVPRFVGIEVRSDAVPQPCSNSFGYVALAPRQQLTAAPFANHARSAMTLAAADASPSVAVFVDSDGKVGMGTTAPSFPLHVVAPEPVLALQDFDSTLTQTGYVSLRDSGNIERGWMGYGSAPNPHLSIVNARASADIALNTTRDIVMVTGNAERIRINTLGSVGIGITPVAFKLDVAGSVRCTSLTQTSSATFKNDITPLTQGLTELLALEPVSYCWNDLAPETTRGKHDLGLIAEEVAKVLPDAVAFGEDGNAVGIDYSRITVLAVQAIKDQQARMEAQREQHDAQTKNLLARIEALEARLPAANK